MRGVVTDGQIDRMEEFQLEPRSLLGSKEHEEEYFMAQGRK